VKGKKITAITALLVAAVILVCLDVILVEHGKVVAEREAYENERIKRELLEEIKSEEAREVTRYYLELMPVRDEYIKGAVELSRELENEFVNIGQVKELTSERLDGATAYRDKLLLAKNIPAPLENFYNWELDFINSDIETIELVLSYYDSGNYSTFDGLKIKESYIDTGSLFMKAEEELKKVIDYYGL
jgi:hypothetical protein